MFCHKQALLLLSVYLLAQLSYSAPLPFQRFLRNTRAADYRNYLPASPGLMRKDFDEMKAYILNYYDGVKVMRSFPESNNSGIVDCVVTATQPALRGRAAHFLPAACEEGTIPLHRITLEQLVRAKTLRGFLQKSDGESGPPIR